MHIQQEGTITTLTTCTKMTEEVDRRHGVNGNRSSKSPVEDAPGHNTGLTGGRLKFFKDGKFILELVRGSGREGERAGWVSVGRAVSVPAGAVGVAAGPGRAGSLCASDDTSSLQSSPWQRDHCWKQAAPRRNQAAHLALYYCRPSTLRCDQIAAASRLKRRRPLHAGPPSAPSPPAPMSEAESRELFLRMKLKKPHYRKLRVYRKTRPALRPRDLARVVERLRERASALPAPPPAPPPPAPAPLHAKLASCRQEHAMVSPRKRILRELERVSLEEGGGGKKRRADRGPAAGVTAGAAEGGGSAPAPPLHSAYSIHSLLAEERRPVARPAVFRVAPPPLWLHYSPPPWPPLPLHAIAPRDDPPSDLPLNLSKH